MDTVPEVVFCKGATSDRLPRSALVFQDLVTMVEQLARFLGVSCDKAQLESLIEHCHQLVDQCCNAEALPVGRGTRPPVPPSFSLLLPGAPGASFPFLPVSSRFLDHSPPMSGFRCPEPHFSGALCSSRGRKVTHEVLLRLPGAPRWSWSSHPARRAGVCGCGCRDVSGSVGKRCFRRAPSQMPHRADGLGDGLGAVMFRSAVCARGLLEFQLARGSRGKTP